MNRREFLASAAKVGSGLGASGLIANTPPRSYSEEFPNMALSYLAGRVNALAERWDQERARIRTPEQLEARNRWVRQKFLEMIHGYPERHPLNPVVVRSFERSGYRVENIMFQSRPNFWVPGNLYVPTASKPPFPGIISPTGHFPEGRMYRVYQSAYIALAKSGIMVFAYDAIGQGERRQYWDPRTDVTEVGGPTDEHSMPGQLLLLLGEDLTHYRVWDGMRALDYLLTRPEVDKERIGCTGNSGGGTLTLFISALDDRIKCAAVSEGGTSHRWPLRITPGSSVGQGDVEQNLFPSAIYGIDKPDLHVAIAPRPLLALIENYTPQFNRAAEAIRSRYVQLGVADRFATVEATDPHAWTAKLRVATTDWFCRWFFGRPGPAEEPEFEVEPVHNLYCTPNGSLRYSQQGETIFSLILKKQATLPPGRAVPSTPGDVDSHRQEMIARITELLQIRKLNHPLDVRSLVTTPRKGYRVEKVEFLSEPGIYIPTWVFLPRGTAGPSPATLYVHEGGKQAEGMEFGVLETMVKRGQLVIAVDVRGIGDTRPQRNSGGERAGEYRHLFDVETAMSYIAWHMNESLFGMRVQDVMRSVDYVLSRADADKAGVNVIGKGMGALWALYAAALDSRIRSVVCQEGLVSYRSLASVDRYSHGANIFIRDVLKYFDLPQVAAAVADRPLTLMSPMDSRKRRADAATTAAYQWTASAYRAAGAPDRFKIV
jgi:cephalosporin-C deacetylase-like acetyl esterase